MPTLYLLEQGAKLSKTSKRLVIEKDREVLSEIPEFKIEKVFVFGNVQITTQALKFLLGNNIDVSFFNMKGKLIGKLFPFESKNVYLRMAQYDAFKNEEFKLKISKKIVEGKIKNCLVVFQKFLRNHPEVELKEEIDRLNSALKEVERKTQISSLLGLEGISSKVYFKGFSKMFKNGFDFRQRTRHPPLDPVNSLLSLGYSLITSEMFSILFALGLDPYVGFFHTLEYGRASLALDLIEEFRPVIVDRLVLDLINKNMLKQEDFEYEKTEEGKVLKVLLNQEAKRVFFSQYEKRMNTQITLPQGNVSYRRLFDVQARKMIECIKSNSGDYEPFLIK